MIHFNLVPHTRNIDIGIDIRGSIAKTGEKISLIYKLEGDVNELVWPTPSRQPSREMNLWQATCFELFISNPSESCYHEFNLSSSGNWQSFSFSDYRANRSISNELQLSSMQQSRQINSYAINATIECLISADVTDSFQIGLSTVLLDRSGNLHYFALSHGGPKPDFHRRDAHQLKLAVNMQ